MKDKERRGDVIKEKKEEENKRKKQTNLIPMRKRKEKKKRMAHSQLQHRWKGCEMEYPMPWTYNGKNQERNRATTS